MHNVNTLCKNIFILDWRGKKRLIGTGFGAIMLS